MGFSAESRCIENASYLNVEGKTIFGKFFLRAIIFVLDRVVEASSSDDSR
jgi:hypothetical protein